MGTTQAQPLAVHFCKLAKVHALPTPRANQAFPLGSRQFTGLQVHLHPLLSKQLCVGQFAVGHHLLPAPRFHVRIELPRQLPRVFQRHHPHPAPRREIKKRSRHLAPVAELQRPLAQPASGHQSNCIRGAPVDLDKRNQSFAIRSPRVRNPQPLQAQQCHTNAQNLPRAQVPVRRLRLHEKFVQRFHSFSQPC